MSHRLKRRLWSLLCLELVNIPLHAAVWFGIVGFPASAANLVGFALFGLLLCEGAGYWAAKLRQLTAGRRRPGRLVPFRVLRMVNPLLLAAGVVFTGAAVRDAPGAATIPGLCFAVFAVAEHVNYFHTQLMHDTAADLRRLRRKGFRRSHLARDLVPPRRRVRHDLLVTIDGRVGG